ncbi:Holliday junction resolvase RuvX [Gilvibacter sp.]|uniref:Holliday junction resolvase RuvX n=1 Tax=Gilvibacter sp. TaxID=2729997 RepID=UPI0025C52B5F|nr:Holliday junction resolvase RuvX [Gilvibacter sp.]NQX78291.1 Holliday junction resolvase RuvX [Gilvibacter sp.]
MPRIIAIDYGTKRTGLAVTDPLRLIASGLTTVETAELLPFLKDYFEQEAVDLVLIGQPKRHDGSFSDVEQEIAAFALKLAEAFPSLEIKRMDERFTSKMAFQAMIDGGLSKKQRQNKALIDQVSATIILQEYLEYHL